MENNSIACPFCGTIHAYPADGKALNSVRPCCKGVTWLVTTDPGDEMADLAEGEEGQVVWNVGKFEGKDTPEFVEPTHAVFFRQA